ncbi:MAG: KUP/HAK/KT family potassium transporter, partial [Alphaproteobacteria bacterium]
MSNDFLTNQKIGRAPHSGALSGLVLTALGIVFGDIGTSPLYAFQVIIGLTGGTPSRENILGLFSLIIWALMIIVSLKYVTFVMRADNDGEGGILALASLLKREGFSGPWIAFFGVCGAAFIYGDGTITPAISVLSAVEGIKVISPAVTPFVLPISVVILFSLFAFQYHGTARIGWVFGPVMMLWFIVLALLGVRGILHYPAVLLALNPWYGIRFVMTEGWTTFLVLGGVFLAVTGAEALYADMGHVGARPIRIAWYGLVLPALLLNYAGQAAMLLSGEPVGDSIFYNLCPSFLMVPLIGLATMATIVASQAIITGAFSMTRQAIQLDWCPRLHITQTSARGYGQIYIGAVNWMLMVGTLILTVSFGSSDRLASAYGIAVSLTMLF